MYSGGWKDKARIAIGKSANGIIANSQGGADYWQGLNASGQIIVIPNAIKPLNAVKPDHPWDGKPYFLSAGRLSHEKNAVTAAKAIIAAVEDCPDNYGAIVGDGPDRDFIAELTVKSSASARLRMVGYSSDLEAWLRHATAYISASYVEGQPNVVIEAAQARCPLILSNIKPHHEAVGEGAVYIDADDIAGFAKALAMTATDPSASTMRLDLAFARTGLSALEKITANHVEFYHHVLAQS
jgi:glycosyltransferase involved in cell wall biosynthesis